ncbi:MAG: hypothetical protein P8Z35_02320 [Ignavibacteriaceae bacterium]
MLKNDNLQINELDSYKDSLAQNSWSLKRTLKLGASYTLLVGKDENLEASTLINFLIPLPDSIKNSINADSITVTGANIQLFRAYPTKENNSFYDFTVHKVESEWTSNFTADSLQLLSYDPSDISSNKSLTDSLEQFNISSDFAYSLLKYATDSLGSDFGLYIKPTENSKKVVGYYSLYNSVNVPRLTIAIQKLGSYPDTLYFYGSSNVSVVTGNIPPSSLQSRIVLEGGLVANSKLWFDISKIPYNAIINNAKLTLKMDTAETYIGDTTNSILASFLTDSSSIVLDSTNVVTFSTDNNSMTGTITSYVQKWVNTRVNEGVLLYPRNQIGSVDLFTFYGSDAIDSLKPRLHIIYTLKK